MLRFLVLLAFPMLCALTAGASGKSASPVLNADSTVTFRVTFPDADEVVLRGSFLPRKEYLKTSAGALGKEGSVEMEQDGDVWTYTTAKLPSDMYTYSFEVDGENRLDPNNSNTVRETNDTLNYFIVGGGLGDDFVEHKGVARGRLEHVWYPSAMKGMSKRRMTVYLPAAYAKDSKERFPVLYLLHGSGGDEDSWTYCGRVAQILDNLIAQGRCCPMIVVMPNGNADLAATPGADPANPDVKPNGNNTSSMLGKIESVFMNDVVKYTDSHFRTIADKENRAIAGLSLGGLQTMYIAMNNPKAFDYVGLFSAQTTNALNNRRIDTMQKVGDLWDSLKQDLPFLGGGKVDRTISKYTSSELDIYENTDKKLQAQFADPPKLYYIALGSDDFVKKLNDDYRKTLDAGHYKYYYHETTGGHTWDNWRRYLVDFLPRIF